MRILSDIDGVLADFWSSFQEFLWYNQSKYMLDNHFNLRYEKDPSNYRAYGQDMSTFVKAFASLNGYASLMPTKYIMPIYNCVESNKISYMTARQGAIAQSETREWVEKYVGHSDRISYIEDQCLRANFFVCGDFDVLLEDEPNNINETIKLFKAYGTKKTIIMPSYRYNAHCVDVAMKEGVNLIEVKTIKEMDEALKKVESEVC